MKRFLCAISICVTSVLSAKVGLHDLERVPGEAEIGQFVVESSHTRPTRKMSREEFMGFFRHATFAVGEATRRNVYSDRYEAARSDRATAPKSVTAFCQGAFATKSGEVFLWRLVKEKVLEIEDSEHRTGWLIRERSQENGAP